MKKSYIDMMNQLSADAVYEGLLAYGMFSERLPPVFSSELFYQYMQTPNLKLESKDNQYIYYENMRNINLPRALGIPTPVTYAALCKCIQENWAAIVLHFDTYTNNQTYKVSRIHVRKLTSGKQIFEMTYKNWNIDGTPEPDLLIGKKYMVSADISNCFPSMYTHSLPWALIGKDAAKKDRGPTKWYNQIDAYSRKTKNGETQGLLIGPHSSNILSEIILCPIDNELISKGYEFIRNIDDYTCYVNTIEDGELFLSVLATELRKFNLSLNHKKTRIAPLPKASVEQWVRKINTLDFKTKDGYITYKSLRSYLDNVLELMQSNGDNASTIKYAIKTLSKQPLSANAKVLYAKTLSHLASLNIKPCKCQ